MVITPEAPIEITADRAERFRDPTPTILTTDYTDITDSIQQPHCLGLHPCYLCNLWFTGFWDPPALSQNLF